MISVDFQQFCEFSFSFLSLIKIASNKTMKRMINYNRSLSVFFYFDDLHLFTVRYFLLQPMTNAERKRKYLENLKASGKYDDFKKDNAAYQKQRRTKINAGVEAFPKRERERIKRQNRNYIRKKVAECRQRKKPESAVRAITTSNVSSIANIEGSYKTASALAKAVAKVKRALPSTAQKKKQVVAKILKSFNSNDLEDVITNDISNTKRTRLSATDIDIVRSFFERDDISRISPNVKDCRKFVNPSTGDKEFKQLRYLQYKLADAYSLFVKHIKNGKIQNNRVSIRK